MDFFSAIKAKALRDIVLKDDGAMLRRIFRWYSVKYFTPLHIVETLPMEHLLQTYWEATYDEMSEEEIDREVFETLKTPEKRRQEEIEYDAEQVDSLEFAERVKAKATQGAKIKDIQPDKAESLIKKIDGVQSSLDKLSESLDKLPSTLDELKELPPNVNLKFDIQEDDLDLDSIPIPEKPKPGNL